MHTEDKSPRQSIDFTLCYSIYSHDTNEMQMNFSEVRNQNAPLTQLRRKIEQLHPSNCVLARSPRVRRAQNPNPFSKAVIMSILCIKGPYVNVTASTPPLLFCCDILRRRYIRDSAPAQHLPPFTSIYSPIQPPEQMLGALSKPAFVVPRCTARLQQLLKYLADFGFADSVNVKSG